ncbi:tyrosine-type recombinase/integrase [Persicitalea jodogahamensis]|uniref:Uncharacterized protein n=1 Tax=Persicitalea jodogahamensis TaxID=402147 RepID=A0A8J3G976_9BACT|nr:site-specific integrase [Persicitalea jodogahamensis]GHB64289.1 hypothetical protein GCM10007390_17720 [Persicitalea jodogahamensis]
MPSFLEKYPFREAFLSDSKGDLSKKWYINYYAWSEQKGKLIRKRVVINHPTAKERYAQAKIIIEAINAELKAGAVVEPIPYVEPEVSPSMAMEKAVAFYLSAKEKEVGKNTIKTYKKDLRAFSVWLKEADLEKLPLNEFDLQDVFDFSDYLDRRKSPKTGKIGMAKKTYSNIIGTMRGMWAMLIGREIISENPFLKVKKRKGGRTQHIPYVPWQVREYKNICLRQVQDRQLWLFVNFIYFCFLRPREEAQKLQIKHILKRTLIIPGDLAKNNNSEHVRIPKGLEDLIVEYKLRSYPPGYYVFSKKGEPGPQPVNDKYFWEHNKKILQLAGFTDQDYDLYGWKHTGVIKLYQATKDIKLVQVQCRHKDISTTDIYLRDLGLFLDQDALDIFPDPEKD